MTFSASNLQTFLRTLFLAALCLGAASAAAQPPARPAPARDKAWTLVWSDEFNGPEGSLPDPARWSLVTGGSGFGNNELETYTDRPANAHLEGGNLVITALREQRTGPDGAARNFTSARLQSKGHFETQYGRIEARIKVPAGAGLWPAFWMLGSNHDSAGWPDCGEIDIMENIGKEPGIVHATLHGPRYSGEFALTGGYRLPPGQRFSDRFHRFAVEWQPDLLRFYVDGHLYGTQNIDSIPYYKQWAFNHPFYLLLNLAVGGNWPGMPDASTVFPARMLVDYVRVYKPAPAPRAAAH